MLINKPTGHVEILRFTGSNIAEVEEFTGAAQVTKYADNVVRIRSNPHSPDGQFFLIAGTSAVKVDGKAHSRAYEDAVLKSYFGIITP
jgi:hypothetical protein